MGNLFCKYKKCICINIFVVEIKPAAYFYVLGDPEKCSSTRHKCLCRLKSRKNAQCRAKVHLSEYEFGILERRLNKKHCRSSSW